MTGGQNSTIVYIQVNKSVTILIEHPDDEVTFSQCVGFRYK